MSADNGIYIHKFRDGWRVCHTQCIENIFWKRGDRPYNYRELKRYFKDSPLFPTRLRAMQEAMEMYDKIMSSDFPILEYGISFV